MGETAASFAMFFAGLKILQTMNLCFAGSFPVLLQFGIPPKQIGAFIGITGACLNFWAAMGVILGFALGFFNFIKFKFPACITAITTIALFLVQIRITSVCMRCSGCDGVRKYFFWLCASALFYQSDALLCTATWGLQSAWFFLGLEITNVLIPIVHFIAWLFFKCFGGQDILFWKLCFQLGSMLILTGVCVVLWCFSIQRNWDADGTSGKRDASDPTKQADLNCVEEVNGPQKDDGSADESDTRKWTGKFCSMVSPFFMGILGMGSIFWLFPVIFPFMVCHFRHFEFTQKLNLALGAVATLIVWTIAECHRFNIPSFDFTKWQEKFKFHDWSGVSHKAKNGGEYWNMTWFILFPVAFLTWMFFKCLHYPRGSLGRSILYYKKAVVLGCIFFFFSQLFKAFGLTGCFVNAILTAGYGPVGNIGFMCSMIHLTASLFTNQAYSVGYGSFKSAVDSGCSWPTQGLGGFRSYWWWHRYGIKNGTKRFIGLRKIDIVAVIS